MKISLAWLQDVAFSAQTEGGHRIVFDGPPTHGGKNRGARPMEGVLAASAACSAFDVVNILKKSKQIPESLEMEITAERAAQEPAIFTKIHLKFTLSGQKLRPPTVTRAIALSVEKYCSALAMLNKTAKVSHSWEIKPISESPAS
ncbi:MAG: OsmC family protein [Candidatus Zeuxoniibacter abyssi]|nr:MAG: OsmC family protein [Candidatus Persebacteraceae bacterium AB1(2)]